MESRKETHSNERALVLTISAVCLETVICTLLLLRIPADSKNAIILGLSKERLLMILAFGMLLILNLILLSQKDRLYRIILSKPAASAALQWTAAVSLFFVLLPDYRFGRKAAYYARCKPFILWLFLASLTFAVFCCFDRDRFAGLRKTIRGFGKGKKFILCFLAVLVCGTAFVEISGLGKTVEASLWNKNGIPLQSIQLYSTLLIFILLQKLRIIGFLSKRSRLLNFLLVWAAGALIWSLAPFSDHFFSPGPYAPNSEYYPYSDALTYDISAQTALNGWGFNLGRTILKPSVVFIDFLTHLITGNDFNRAMLVQSGLYAILPAVIYLFGCAIAGSGCGYLAAAFSILKEWNALSTHSVLTVSSRLIMSEFLTQILLAVLAYSVFRWLKKTGGETFWAALSGGALALGIFTRYNFMAFFPAAILILGIGYRKEMRRLLKPMAVFCLTLFLTAAPILIRDQIRTGGAFNELIYTIKNNLIGRRFAEPVETEEPVIKTKQPDTELKPTETIVPTEIAITATPAATAAVKTTVPTAAAEVKTQIAPISAETSLPAETKEEEINTGKITQELSNNNSIKILPVFTSMINHGLHNFIASSLTVPMELTFQDLEHLYINEEGGLWVDRWDGRFTSEQWILAAVWILLFAAAGGMLLKLHGLAGFSILYFWLVYAFSIGFSRSSGGRYVVPCNWIPMLMLAFLCSLVMGMGEIQKKKERPIEHIRIKTAAAIMLFTSFFTSMALTERFMPAAVTTTGSGDLAVMMESFAETKNIDWELVENQIRDGSMHLTHGIALYPRFYYYQQGEHTQTGALMTKDFSRMTFEGINLENKKRLMQEYLMPQMELIEEFPQDSVFRALSCKSPYGYEDVLALRVETPDGEIYSYLRDPLPEFTCPVPEPVCIEIGKCR